MSPGQETVLYNKTVLESDNVCSELKVPMISDFWASDFWMLSFRVSDFWISDA